MDKLLDKLIKSKAILDATDKTHQCTPLAWAIHCLMSNDEGNKHNQTACIKLLLQSGTDIKKLSTDHNKYLQLLAESDRELNNLLQNH